MEAKIAGTDHGSLIQPPTTLVAQAITIALGFVSVATLGRLLTPEDFGLVAMTSAFIAVVTSFANLGLPQSTVQRDQITDEQINALFWINAGTGAVATVIGILAAWPVAWFYDRPELVAVTAALAVGLVINAMSAQHQALLRREMRFAQDARKGRQAAAVEGFVDLFHLGLPQPRQLLAEDFQDEQRIACRAGGFQLVLDERVERPRQLDRAERPLAAIGARRARPDQVNGPGTRRRGPRERVGVGAWQREC